MHVAAQASADLARVSSQTWQNKVSLAAEQKKKHIMIIVLEKKRKYLNSQIYYHDTSDLELRELWSSMYRIQRDLPYCWTEFLPISLEEAKYSDLSLFFWKSPSPNRRSPTIFLSVLMRSMCGEEWNVGWDSNRKWRRGTQGRTIKHRYYIPHKTPTHLKQDLGIIYSQSQCVWQLFIFEVTRSRKGFHRLWIVSRYSMDFTTSFCTGTGIAHCLI